MSILETINAARAAAGVAPLQADPRLDAAALRHAQDIATHPGLVHVGSDGSTIYERVAAAGYQPVRWGEVVGWGFDGDEGRMVQWWLDSPEHRPLLLNPDYADAGAAHVVEAGTQWGHYWCVDFGRTATPPPPPPRPYTSHVPIVIGGGRAGIDLLAYLRGDGRAYRVGNSRGTFEVFQTQTEGDRFYQVKAWDDLSVVYWEGFSFDEEYIRRDVDTSPGGGRFYRQFDAPWVRRYMWAGDSFTQAKRVQFYRLDDCAPLAIYSGDVVDTITVIANYPRYTFPARDWPAVTLEDVVQLRWSGGEDYWYARGLGLVAWARTHQDAASPAWSAIAEMRPDVGRLRRLAVPCVE